MKKEVIELTEEQKKLKEQLEYGDITNLTIALDVSRMTIWNTLNGRRQSQYIWEAIGQLIESRSAERAKKITNLISKKIDPE